MTWKTRLPAAIQATIVALQGGRAAACASCYASSSGGTLLGYYLSTAILSLTPFLIVGLMLAYVAHKRGRSARAARNTAAGH
jgi:hypothetical protein